MNHPLEPKKPGDIHADQAMAMDGTPAVEPGRREYALDPGPEEFQVDLYSLANPRCNKCYGRAIIKINKPGSTKLYPTPCECAEKGYQKFMAKRITFPCRKCGQVGYCQHRPRTFAQLLSDLLRTSVNTRMAMEPREARRKHGAEQESSGQNLLGVEDPTG